MPPRAIITAFLSCLLIACQDIPQRITTGLEGKPIPPIDLLLQDSLTHINTAKITPGRPTVLLYVDPNCHFCQGQIRNIEKNIGALQNIQFYILTTSSFGQMTQLSQSFGLAKYRNISVGVDTKHAFTDYFTPPGFPYTVVYRSDQTLHSVFLGEITIADIIKASKD